VLGARVRIYPPGPRDGPRTGPVMILYNPCLRGRVADSSRHPVQAEKQKS